MYYDPDAVYQDADIEQWEFEQVGREIDAGLCPICGDMLNPLAAKWGDDLFEQERDRYGKPLHDRAVARLSRQRYAELLGPSADGVAHDRCYEMSI